MFYVKVPIGNKIIIKAGHTKQMPRFSIKTEIKQMKKFKLFMTYAR